MSRTTGANQFFFLQDHVCLHLYEYGLLSISASRFCLQMIVSSYWLYDRSEMVRDPRALVEGLMRVGYTQFRIQIRFRDL